jgi:hypothetical protein
MLATRTGSFPIGFRRGWSDWQKDISSVIGFAKETGFGGIDIGNEVADAEAILAARDGGLPDALLRLLMAYPGLLELMRFKAAAATRFVATAAAAVIRFC